MHEDFEKDILTGFYADVYDIIFVAETVEGVHDLIEDYEATATHRLKSYHIREIGTDARI